MDQKQFDLRYREIKLYIDQGLTDEALSITNHLLSELKSGEDSEENATRIQQVESLAKNNSQEDELLDSSAPSKVDDDKPDEDLFVEAGVFQELESYTEAIRIYTALIQRDFKLSSCILELVACYRKLGQMKKAQKFLAALTKDPQCTAERKDICLYYLSFLNEETGNYVGAMEALDAIGAPWEFHDFANRKKALQSKIRGRTKFDYLISNKLVSANDVKRAQILAKKEFKSIEYILINSFKIPAYELGKSLSMYHGYPFIDLSKGAESHPELFTKLKVDYLKKNHWAPLSRSDGGKIKIIVDDPTIQKLDDINKIYHGTKLEFFIAIREFIDEFIDGQFETRVQDDTPEEDVSDFLDGISSEFEADFDEDEADIQENVQLVDNKVIMFVNKMIVDATRKRVSDIHIEPSTHSRNADIRFRVDGICQPYIKIPNSFCRPVISRIKIMARMDITERRKPMDGKIKFKSKSTGAIELRVVSIPTSGSREDVVLRILRSGKPRPLSDLGVLEYILDPLMDIIHQPYGLVLVVGPTGSGKTTTLHSALHIINTPEKKIWTAEDPVEIDQKGIRQSEVHPKIGLGFATLLRSFLRADPDVIMVGEMRDMETTKTAIEASLTGHLVFSTLHTNNAPETITRLLEMDIDPTNFADSLLAVLSQRLGRTLCNTCKEPVKDQKAAAKSLVEEFGEDKNGVLKRYIKEGMTIFQPKGCPVCDNTGYFGRIAFHEFLLNNTDIRRQIKKRATTEQIRDLAVAHGMYTLKQDGIIKIFQGLTDLGEVRRNCI